MGSYPRQDFIYGIGFTSDLSCGELEETNELEEFASKNNLDYSIAGNCCDGFQCGLVIGFEFKPKFKDGYIGGYHTVEFPLKEMVDWWQKSIEQMTEDMRHKIVKFMEKYCDVENYNTHYFHTTPKLWTVSSFG